MSEETFVFVALAFVLGLWIGRKGHTMGVLRSTIDAMKADRDAIQGRLTAADADTIAARAQAAKAAEDLAQAQANALDPAEVTELQALEKDFRALATAPTDGTTPQG